MEMVAVKFLRSFPALLHEIIGSGYGSGFYFCCFRKSRCSVRIDGPRSTAHAAVVFCYLLFDLGHRLCGFGNEPPPGGPLITWRGVAQSQFGFPLASTWTRWSFVALRVFNNREVKVDPPG